MVIERVVERQRAPAAVHNHITHVTHITQVLRQGAYPPRREGEGRGPFYAGQGREERARPTLAARRLIRLFSTASARRELTPLLHTAVGQVLRREREAAQSRPEQGVRLVYHLLGERALERLLERSAPAAEGRAAPPRAGAVRPGPAEEGAPRLSEAELQALLRAVERALDRRERHRALRRGRA